MKLRTAFDQREDVALDAFAWVTSPADGVERKMIERDGEEVARATSVVRFAPGSRFSSHTHELGEEFLVLDGVFQDEHGSYPAGTYVRNPRGSSHQPFSDAGCVLFVKLRQFALGDAAAVVANTSDGNWGQLASGVHAMPLHAYGSERVAMVSLDAGGAVTLPAEPRGIELLVLDGAIDVAGRPGAALSWHRIPNAEVALYSRGGGRCWVKRGHLPGAR